MYNHIISSSFIALSLAAQGGGIFYQLTSAHGLSSDRTQAVIRDREGFYRIATQDGLNRFDGSSCKVYRNNRNDSNSLSHNNSV
jgi:ligand-binding sensor domain-containing protein